MAAIDEVYERGNILVIRLCGEDVSVGTAHWGGIDGSCSDIGVTNELTSFPETDWPRVSKKIIKHISMSWRDFAVGTLVVLDAIAATVKAYKSGQFGSILRRDEPAPIDDDVEDVFIQEYDRRRPTLNDLV